MKRQVIGTKTKISLDVQWEVLSLNSVKNSVKDKTTLDYLFRENFSQGPGMHLGIGVAGTPARMRQSFSRGVWGTILVIGLLRY